LYRLAQRALPAEICTIFLARRDRPMRRFRASIVVSGTVFSGVLLLIVDQAAMQHLRSQPIITNHDHWGGL
jgi:hypothetical protein